MGVGVRERDRERIPPVVVIYMEREELFVSDFVLFCFVVLPTSTFLAGSTQFSWRSLGDFFGGVFRAGLGEPSLKGVGERRTTLPIEPIC